VIKHDSIQTIFSLAATHDMGVIQYDVKTTFLYGDLQEEIFMEQPKGYVKLETKQLVCCLCKNIYGLRETLANGI
jgi:hypothetical protein